MGSKDAPSPQTQIAARVDQADSAITPPSDYLWNVDEAYAYHWKSINPAHPSSVQKAVTTRHLSNGQVMAPYEIVRYSTGVKVQRLFDDGPQSPGMEDVVRDRDLVLCRIHKSELAKLDAADTDYQMGVENALVGGQEQNVLGGAGRGGATVKASLKDIQAGTL